MKITKYKQTNIKGSSVEFTVGEVTLLTGPNRSSKTSRLEGISLAAIGRSSIGATAAKLSELIGIGNTSASAKLCLDNGEEAQWIITQSDSHGKITNSAKHAGPDVFGSFVSPADFWALTGEQKWQTIGSLVTGASSEIETAAKSISAAASIALRGDSLLTKLSNLQADIKDRRKSLGQKATEMSASLVAPEEYVGEPLQDLLRRRAETERFIADQSAARKTHKERSERKARREKDIATLLETEQHAIEIANENRATADALRDAADRIRPYAQQVADLIGNESQAVAQCRITPIGQTLRDNLVAIHTSLGENLQIPMLSGSVQTAQLWNDITSAMDHVNYCIMSLQKQGVMDMLNKTLPVPPQVAIIDEILAGAPTKCKLTCIKDYTHATDFLLHELTVVESAQRKMEATAASARSEITRLESQEAIDQATHCEVCPEDKFIEALQYLDMVNRQIAKAQQWPEYLARQEQVGDQMEKLNAEIERLDGYSTSVRKLRERLLQAASSPIEQYANQLVTACGYEPLELVVTSTDKTSSLSVQTASSVDLSALCGAERVVYGLALLMAIQHYSSAPCPLRIIECAELDPDTLTRLLVALTKMGANGNTVLASWVTPTQIPPGVTIVDCTTRQRTHADPTQAMTAPSPAP